MADKYSTIIDVSELQKIISSCFVFDCRSSLADDEYGEKSFADNHLPNAQFADLNRQLSGPIISGETGRHPLPVKGNFIEQICEWGVTSDAQVIVYDDNNGAFASRLWWMFRWVGHKSVAVLNGGLQAWHSAGLELTTDVPVYETSRFQQQPPLTNSINADDLLAQECILTDARDPARFRGEVEPIDAIAGHIPGAMCLPFVGNLDGHEFKTREVLKQRFTEAGIEPESIVTCYCGSGVTAAHNILALVHAGFREPSLYPGSWSEWITNPERPVATGD